MTSATDNGLSLQQHVLLLFVSIVVSVVLHFGILYFWGDRSVASATAVPTHREPTEYPVVHIETLLQGTQILPAESSSVPSSSAAAAASAEALPERAQNVSMSKPVLTPAALPTWEAQAMGLPHAPAAPEVEDVAPVRQEIATMAEFTPPAETYWTVNAEIPRVPVAPLDLASSVVLPKGEPPKQLPPALGNSGAWSEGMSLLGSGAVVPDLPEMTLDELVPEGEESLASTPESEVPSIEAVLEEDKPVVREIDQRLAFTLAVYEPSGEDYRYFRLDVQRRSDADLPVMEKDVVFIQDVSVSIGKNRLERCKRALKSALFNTLRIGDRFNVFAFRDQTLTPMSTWSTFNNTTRLRVETFIDSLRAAGSTNLFLLLNDLRSLPSDPKRPFIAVVITDGEPTSGVLETTRIISEFSRVNQGEISVYAFGVNDEERYFLDMLCYTNRGENTTIKGNPSKIDTELTPVFSSIRNPVMKDLELTMDVSSKGEVHPRYLTPLYADRPITVFGRVPKSTAKATCRLSGDSSTTPYDAVFTLNFETATKTRTNLRKFWAERAMFDLLADYAANPSAALELRIRNFAQAYGVRNPYKKD